ncbi:hypothetical protein LZG04_11575 [Saccharothrix sp. S26]|uniref:hypothetical protein n=1 Tax=Saccharothrix sp. S26 TaxID=2907215 RepID=UPI001F2F906D|nr:hypothetical protein [Saccharothrix sp. S26]MCE6995441.1 hypothetical protein [Saccharothrix sp. S26]
MTYLILAGSVRIRSGAAELSQLVVYAGWSRVAELSALVYAGDFDRRPEMTSATGPAGGVPGNSGFQGGRMAGDLGAGAPAVRRADLGTKPSFRTTEFFVFLAAVAAVVVTALVVGGDADTADPFNAEQALRYVTFLAIGYMISRGLAKAGSRRRDVDHR